MFRIVKALSGNSYYRNFVLLKSSDGRRIASDRADLHEPCAIANALRPVRLARLAEPTSILFTGRV